MIPLLFWSYICLARLLRSRIPHPLGQLLGTLLLYLSLAFMLGLVRHAGWNPDWAIFEPGGPGLGLARFFVLNFGALGAVLASVGMFLLSALFFHSRLIRPLLAYSSSLAQEELPSEQRPVPPQRRDHAPSAPRPPIRMEAAPDGPIPGPAPIWEPEPVPAPKIEPVPEPKPEPVAPVLEPAPALKPEPIKPILEPPVWEPEPATESEGGEDNKGVERSAVAILDDLLSSFEAGAFNPPEGLLPPPSEDAAPAAQPLEPQGERPAPEPLHDFEPPPVATGKVERRQPQAAFPPPLDLLGPTSEEEEDQEALGEAKRQGGIIVETLRDFGVNASVAHIVMGPSIVQFQLELAPGTKVSKVSSLTNELTMALAVVSVRIEAPIPGLPYVGVEIPNSRRRSIPLRTALESQEFQSSTALLPLPMGMQVDSRFLVFALEEMPHLLVAGTTGSGKSVFVNCCILGMCLRRTPDELRLILVDPKHVEFAVYEGLPHLLALPVSDPRKAVDALAWAVQEMESRMEAFARAHVRNLASYNAKALPKDRFPSIVVVVDELADLMYSSGKEVEGLIVRLAQKARAAGIHLILATQRPSVDVITGLIKANVPARAAFAVPSQTDSRTIIDTGGADKLLGKGDLLFLSTRSPRPVRLQSPFITEERTLDLVRYLKAAFGEPEYIEFEDSTGPGSPDGGGNGAVDDPKMEEAIRAVMDMGVTSASGLQSVLRIGYPKAGRLIAAMERLGILGPRTPNSMKPREILMDEESAYEVLERARAGELYDED